MAVIKILGPFAMVGVLVAANIACKAPAATDGSVDSPGTFDCGVTDVTINARDLAAGGEIVDSERYENFEHGFSLQLPHGRYAIELVDANDHVFATWDNVIVAGHVTLPARTSQIATR